MHRCTKRVLTKHVLGKGRMRRGRERAKEQGEEGGLTLWPEERAIADACLSTDPYLSDAHLIYQDPCSHLRLSLPSVH
jgi:hypothetical protein